MPDQPTTTLTTKAAANLVCRDVETITSWVRKGWLTPLSQPSRGRGYLYAPLDVMAVFNRIEIERTRPVECNQMTEPDRAYLAGLFDGEGCFSGSSRLRPTEQYTYRAAVNMTDPEAINWAFTVTGLGKLYAYPRKAQKPNYKPIWQWHCYGRAAGALAVAMLPYLKIKSAQARIIIKINNEVRLIQDRRERVTKTCELVRELNYLNRLGPQIAREEAKLFL